MNKPTSKLMVGVTVMVVIWLAIALGTGAKRVIANNFIVMNLNDSGAGSLRQAVLDANASPGADSIAFQDELSGTITLTSGELVISDELFHQWTGNPRNHRQQHKQQ